MTGTFPVVDAIPGFEERQAVQSPFQVLLSLLFPPTALSTKDRISGDHPAAL